MGSEVNASDLFLSNDRLVEMTPLVMRLLTRLLMRLRRHD